MALLISISGILSACGGGSGGGGGGGAGIRYNPANCKTNASDPHPSRHQRGMINAEVRNSCPVKVAKNSAEAKLWEHRWWGFNVINGPNYSARVYTDVMSAYANAGCRDNDIRVTGYGHYEWSGSHVSSAEVSNTKHVSC